MGNRGDTHADWPPGPPVLVDSHCHLDMGDFDSDREAVLERARAAGVLQMMLVGVADGAGGHLRALELAERCGFPACAGVHPHDARLAEPRLYDELAGLAREGRIVAVGEVGLDFHYDNSPRPVQQEVFRRQIRFAREVGLPLVIHTREADVETTAMLQAEGAAEVGGVIHCFTGGWDLARRALDLGFHISFSGVVAFPKAEGIREVARQTPRERILVETDAPYLAPPPHRGRRNEPAFVVEVAREVATLRSVSTRELAELVVENFRRLYRL